MKRHLSAIASVGLVLVLAFVGLMVALSPTEDERIASGLDQALRYVLSDNKYMQSACSFYGEPGTRDIYYPQGSFPTFYTPSVDGYRFHEVEMYDLPDPASPRRLTIGMSSIGVRQPGYDQVSGFWISQSLDDNQFVITVWNSGGGPNKGHGYALFGYKDHLLSRRVEFQSYID